LTFVQTFRCLKKDMQERNILMKKKKKKL
jgi:hypothetical protein